MKVLGTVTVAELVDQAYETALEKGWHDREVCFGEFIALCHSELSEALDDYRNGLPLDVICYGADGKPCGVPTELADTVIRIFEYCKRQGIDIERALLEKMEFNKTRPYRHGDKVI